MGQGMPILSMVMTKMVIITSIGDGEVPIMVNTFWMMRTIFL